MTRSAGIGNAAIAGVAIIIGLGAAMTPGAVAHHSVLPFDGARGTEVSGIVTRVHWRYPHVLIELDVGGDAAAHWRIESESPNVLERLDWTPEVVAAGERLTVLGARAKDGSPAMRCRHVTLANGRRLACF